MASHRLRVIAPRLVPQPPSQPDPVKEALGKLGLTEEQFRAKQDEMAQVLLRNQPFVPKESSQPTKAHNKHTTQLHEAIAASSARYPRGRSESISSSSSSRGPSPAPRTPARKDHGDAPPVRPRDQMELIIEQRNRAKEGRRRASTSRQTEGARVNSTPTHNQTRTAVGNLPPETPHHYRYYSERVVGEASGSRRTLDHPGGPVTPSSSHNRGQFKAPPPPFLTLRTPSNRDHNSSCPPTPRSSPPPIVNLVSSPGPMRATPLEEDECLPYTLPPGPYSALKPELSYAAIIGQAILASPSHALALQDIYEYISTVYPYYRRGEPTWMNSVRHALSTMAVFRKVSRERSEGKSLWAIWDCDLPCFQGGGFKKSLCADMNIAPPKTSRKRSAEDRGASTSKSKRRKATEEPVEEPQPLPVVAPAPMLPPFFPHVAPANPYHQSYYQLACTPQPPPADVLFPPFPPSSNYHRAISRAASIPAASQATAKAPAAVSTSVVGNMVDEVPSSSPVERPPSSSSIPELVPSLSCSSSPAPSSHLSVRDDSSRDPSPVVASASPNMDGPIEDPEATWLQSSAPAPQQAVAVPKSTKKDKGKGKARADGSTVKKPSQAMLALPPPPSPTLERRAATTTRYGFRSPKKPAKKSPTKRSPAKAAPAKPKISEVVARPVTPPPMTASVEEIMRAMEQHAASGQRTRSPSPLSEAEVATMVTSAGAFSDYEEAGERPSSPEPVPPSSSLPSTPPQSYAQLEAELFNFSPFKSPQMRQMPRQGGLSPMIDDSHIPIPSLYTPRAPYLRPQNADELLSNEPGPSRLRSPTDPPRTPQKTSLQRPTSAGRYRPESPWGTPSRGMRSAFDDDLASFFQSPGGSSLFDPFLPSLSKSPVLYGLQSPGFGGQY